MIFFHYSYSKLLQTDHSHPYHRYLASYASILQLNNHCVKQDHPETPNIYFHHCHLLRLNDQAGDVERLLGSICCLIF